MPVHPQWPADGVGRLPFLIISAALLPSSPSSSSHAFVHVGGLASPPSRCLGLPVQGDDGYNTPACDDQGLLVDPCVDIAAHCLVPVLFHDDSDDADEDSNKAETIDAEKALKRCLRQCERVWRDTEGNGDATARLMMAGLPSSSQTERQSSRKRLSDLVLGTAVMRMRHWYVLNQRFGDAFTALGGNYLEPIVGVGPWMMKADAGTSRADKNWCTDARMGIAGDLVRLHAQYLLESDIITDDDEAKETICQWPTDTIQRIAVQQSLPSFIVRLLVDQYGEREAEMLCQLANKPGPITLRRNFIKCESDEALMQRLWEEGGIKSFVPGALTGTDGDEQLIKSPPNGCIRLDFDGGSSASERPTKSLWSLQVWKDGWFEVQDVGSQIIVESVDVQQTDNVIVDFCAGNGGKTLALASQMWKVRQQIGEKPQAGTIIAHDIVGSRLKQITGSLARAGLVSGEENDMGALNDCLPTIRTTSNATSIGEDVADAVLVDAPCSSLGVLRRRTGQRWSLTEDMITQDLPSLQLDILKKASRLVKPGGKLIYATCSISRFENENVIEMFASRDGFSDKWQPWEFEDIGVNYRSILPHRDNSDGFFIARWRRSMRDKSSQ